MTKWIHFLCLLFTACTAVGIRSDPQREVVIKVNGMFCPFCTYGIEKHLKKLPETAAVRMSLADGETIVTLKDHAEFIEGHFAEAIKKAGFTNVGISLRAASPTMIPSGDNIVITDKSDQNLHTTGNPGFSFERAIGRFGNNPGEFNHPISIAFADDGSFAIADSGNARIQLFDQEGQPILEWSVSGDSETPLENPVGIAIAPDGDIWVTDYDMDSISHYRSDGSPIRMFGRPGNYPGGLNSPSELAVLHDGSIAVVEFYNHRIQIFDSLGNSVDLIGGDGFWRRIPPRGLNYPTRVTRSPDGLLWVTDAYNYRIAAFDGNGRLVRKFGRRGTRPATFNVPGGIAVLPDRRLAVCDLLNHRIQIWSSNGIFIGDFGAQGSRQGQFERPTDVALAPDGDLYVVDWGNHRIQVFSRDGEAR